MFNSAALAIWSFISAIPATVWTALLGSGFTLLGVVVANRHSRRQLQTQLAADAAEKARQRKSDLRKSVYLEAAEELVKANTTLATMPQTDIANVNPGLALRSLFASMVKVQLVGDPRTAALANGLASSYGESAGDALMEALPIRDLISKIAIQENLYQGHQAEIARILAEMTANNESGNPDRAGFDAKGRSLEFHNAQAAKCAKVQQDLREAQHELQMKFLHSSTQRSSHLMLELLPLMLELRRELDVAGGQEEFKEMLDAQALRMKAMVAKFSEKIDAHMASAKGEAS